MKNVLILSGSPRRNGNSDLLCDEFFRGAEDAGNQVEKIFVRDKKIGYCNACYGCRKNGKCVIKDDMAEILEKDALGGCDRHGKPRVLLFHRCPNEGPH